MTVADPAKRVAYALFAAVATLAVVTIAKAALPLGLAPLTHAPQPVSEAPAATAPAPTLVSALTYGDPVAGYPIVSPFGRRQLPWEEQGRLHAGVDIAAPDGTPVVATAHGVVVATGQDGTYGRFVELRHAGGLTSFYAHLGQVEPSLKAGAPVLHGAVIAHIGNTGSSTGAHLHFEIRDRQGRPLNPAAFLGQTFASTDDLPLAAASRIPRGTRLAYVSFIPRNRREQMQTREEEAKAEKAAKAAARAALRAGAPTTPGEVADAAAPIPVADGKGRVHMTLEAAPSGA